MRETESSLLRLIRDFGYDVQGNRIIEKGIRGFSSDRVISKCRSVLDATEQLRPIIRDDEFTTRAIQITKPCD